MLVEITERNEKFFAVSVYFDIIEDMTTDFTKTDNILQFTAGSALETAVDSNARSTGRLRDHVTAIWNLKNL